MHTWCCPPAHMTLPTPPPFLPGQYSRHGPLPPGASRLEADKQGNRSATLKVVAHAGFRLLETGCLGDTEALLADITR